MTICDDYNRSNIGGYDLTLLGEDNKNGRTQFRKQETILNIFVLDFTLVPCV